MDKNKVKNFHAVFREELEVVGKSAAEKNLTSLAFSGGGIRSATFNLGVIQSLAKKSLLKKFDYLSTVSGGGYIGSWLSAQICRHSGAAGIVDGTSEKIEGFQNSLRTSVESSTEHDSVKWLRSYSNYLTPRKGLSGDTLSAVGTWLRNTSLNQATLGLFFASLILLLQVALLTLNGIDWLSTQYSNQWLLLSAALICCAIILCAVNLPKARCCANKQTAVTPEGESRRLILPILFIAVCAAYSLSLWIYSTSFWINAWTDTEAPSVSEQISLLKSFFLKLPLIGDSGDTLSPLLTTIQSYWSPIVIAGMLAVIYVLPWIFVAIRSLLKPELKRCAQCPQAQDENTSQLPTECTRTAEQASHSPLQFALFTILFAIAAGIFGGWLISLLSHAVAQQDTNVRLWWASGFGTPLLLVIFCTTLALHQGLMGRMFRVSQLEWWARLGGYMLLIAAAWAGIHALMIYSPPLINMLEYKIIAAGGVVWVVHSLAGVILGNSVATSGASNTPWKEWITRAAPYVFVLGYLVAVSWGVHALMHKFGTADTPHSLNLIAASNQTLPPFSDYLAHALQINNHANIATLWYILVAGTAAFLVLAWRLDVNLFSIHHFYRNRLTRCYLGAGRGDRRMPNPFTGFDPCDDIRLADLKQRPLHLINTALNLVHDKNLAWQDRKAFSFTFSPVACGFEYPRNALQPGGGGYYSSARYMNGVRLGTAMAASGAAASPNMGYHSSPAVAFLLTVFNVRLGHWCPNTSAHVSNQSEIKLESPAIGGEYLLRELLGQTDDEKDFVYLSDGGHFENLAVYELVRRRCRYIMVVDAGQDKDRTFEDAANMIRKCYIDFGVNIDIDLDGLRMDKDGISSSCFALGDITYPTPAEEEDAKENDNWGVLLYIKPSLIKDTPEDILQYAKTHKDFPHQATSDQFFDEAQFESYRHLGNFIMDQVIMSVSQKRTRKDKAWDWEGA